MKNISVIIPAYNEEQSIVSTVESVAEMLSSNGMNGEIIVVDDGSSDSTYSLAKSTQATVIKHGSNHGYGASLKTGIRTTSNEIIAICDADGTYPVEKIPCLYAELNNAEMVVGARTGSSVSIPWTRKPAKWLLRKLASYITGTSIPDLNSGLRVFRKSLALRYFNILPGGFSFTSTLTVASLCDNLEIKFIPINYHPRKGSSKITPTHFPNFIMLVLRLAVLFKPLKVFVPASIFCFIIGFLKLIFDVIMAIIETGSLNTSIFSYPIVSTTAVILLVSSLQMLLFGMVAEAMARRITPSVNSDIVNN